MPYQLPPPCYPFIFPSLSLLPPSLSFIYLSLYQSIYLPTHLSITISICQSINWCSVAADPGAGIGLVLSWSIRYEFFCKIGPWPTSSGGASSARSAPGTARTLPRLWCSWKRVWWRHTRVSFWSELGRQEPRSMKYLVMRADSCSRGRGFKSQPSTMYCMNIFHIHLL